MPSETESIKEIEQAFAQIQSIDAEEEAVATPEFLDKLFKTYITLTTTDNAPPREEAVTIVLAAYKLITENHNLRARLKESLGYIFKQHAQMNRISFAGRH
jgi:hypothetical protein